MQEPIKEHALLLVLVASALLWLLVWYGETAHTMMLTWSNSETYAHGFLIAPISAWLVWRRRKVIRALQPRPNLWMLMPLAAAGFVWLLGHLATVAVVQQYALVFLVLLVIATIVGKPIFMALAFPLLFLLLAVPFGEVLLPMLMEHTADVTIFALRLTGIPVYREGLFFVVPSGSWSVVEACSGLRYLIASFTLGVLYAYLTYRQLRRRLIFIGLSIVVPIVANWLRAYLIVMIGHLSSMKHAVGVDHLIYGWIFFGVVMLLLYWAGSFWREDLAEVEETRDVPAVGLPMSISVWKGILAATVAASGVVAAAPAIASLLQGATNAIPVLQVPPGTGNWRTETGSLTDWRPQFINFSAHIGQIYGNGNGRVELFISYYRNQRPGAQLISSQNALVHSTDKTWANIGAGHRKLDAGGETITLVESRLRGREDTRLLTWHWYWIDGQFTSNAYWAKLLQAKSRLSGRGDNAAVVIVATPYDLAPQQGVSRLQDFVRTMLPAVSKVLQNAR